MNTPAREQYWADKGLKGTVGNRTWMKDQLKLPQQTILILKYSLHIVLVKGIPLNNFVLKFFSCFENTPISVPDVIFCMIYSSFNIYILYRPGPTALHSSLKFKETVDVF